MKQKTTHIYSAVPLYNWKAKVKMTLMKSPKSLTVNNNRKNVKVSIKKYVAEQSTNNRNYYFVENRSVMVRFTVISVSSIKY